MNNLERLGGGEWDVFHGTILESEDRSVGCMGSVGQGLRMGPGSHSGITWGPGSRHGVARLGAREKKGLRTD